MEEAKVCKICGLPYNPPSDEYRPKTLDEYLDFLEQTIMKLEMKLHVTSNQRQMTKEEVKARSNIWDSNKKFDETRCAMQELNCWPGGVYFQFCKNEPGHGPNGLYCEEHQQGMTVYNEKSIFLQEFKFEKRNTPVAPAETCKCKFIISRMPDGTFKSVREA